MENLVCAVPRYPDVFFYALCGSALRPWEFNGWQAESLSWKKTAYIHAGLSGYGPVVFKGPDALQFLQGICTNSFDNYPIGRMKHAVMCDEGGLVTSHCILQRMSEDEFRMFATGPWARYMLSKTNLRVTCTVRTDYLFQVAGPRSLEILERVTGENLRDIGFLAFRNTRIAGITVEIGRIGMAGTLAYELHGPMSDAHEIYDAVYQSGKELGIERLGWRTYFVNHIEGGFPQQIWTFIASVEEDAGYRAFMSGYPTTVSTSIKISGSVDPHDLRARYRTPLELNWHKEVKFDHNFVGRAALEAQASAPKRKTVTLRWNPDDVLDIYASLLRPGDAYKQIELPASPHIRSQHAHADHVLVS